MINRYSKSRRERAAAIDRVIEVVSSWPGVRLAPHQFDAVEFQLLGTEFGHLHRSGRLNVPFVRRLRDALVDDGSASAHPWVPNSGWITFEVHDEATAEHALFLLKLSYLHRVMVNRRIDVDPVWIRTELDSLQLGGRLAEVFATLRSVQ
jgi:hypothetical protein